MSTFRVDVVPIKLEPHPDAHSLSLVHIYGYTCVVRSEDWGGVDRAAYIPPDSIVPDTPEYAWLQGHRRIKTRKFRGVWSQGLLVGAPHGSAIGDDVAEQLGITHYEPPLKFDNRTGRTTEGDAESPPDGYRPHYDVENLRRYALLENGEAVVVTEKIHGTNGRWSWQDGRFWCGSRNQWKQESAGNLWWRILYQYPQLQDLLLGYEGPGTLTLYGEVYGCVQDLRYGHEHGNIALAAFDAWIDVDGNPNHAYWLPFFAFRELCRKYRVPMVPLLYTGPYLFEIMERLATGATTIPGANHVREGVVIRPTLERNHTEIGRVQLKLINNAYLEKAA